MAANLHSKLDSTSDVTNPTLGTGGAEVGSPTYLACEVGNGILSDIDNEGCTFPTAPNNINLDKGSICFYAKMNFGKTDVDDHYFFDFYDAGNGGIRFYFNQVTHALTLEVWEGGLKRQSAATAAVDWSIGDILHFELLWDRGGTDIRSNETLAIFINKVLVVSVRWSWNLDTVNSNLYIGIKEDGNKHSDVVIDELKAYDYCVFIGNYWKEVAPRLDSGVHVYDLCVYKGKLYGTYDGTNTKLVEWNGTDAWIKRVAIGKGSCLKVFDNKLYAMTGSAKIGYWNDVNAWVEDVDLGSFDISEIAEYQGKLFVGSNVLGITGGRLFRRESHGNWTLVAPRYSSDSCYINSLCTHWVKDEYGILREKLFAGTGYNGILLEWNGEDAWIERANAYTQGLGGITINGLLSYEDVQWDGSKYIKVWRLLAVISGLPYGCLLEWDGDHSWNVLVSSGPPEVSEMHDILLYQGDPILGVAHGAPSSLLVMWDGKNSWLPLTTNAFTGSDAIAVLNGKVYAGDREFGKLAEWVPDAPVSPTNLLCCGLASSGHGGLCSPAFISTLTPYFSAIFNDPGEDDVATHYRLRVNVLPDMSGLDLWDSGEAAMTTLSSGQRCANITYDGLTLSTNVTYYWKIAFYDQDGVLGTWSPVNCFRIGTGGVPHSLLCEQKTNPTDVVDANPEFSAIYP